MCILPSVNLTTGHPHNTISQIFEPTELEVREKTMKIFLDRSACIGCGVCTQISPECFVLDEGSGTAKVLKEETEDPSVREAETGCPVGCIRVE